MALLVCYAAGALTALTFAPYYFWPLLFICIPVFFLLLDSASSPRNATWRGFAFGYGYFMAGTWWIANALTVDMEKFGWMIPFCVLGISAALAAYFALFGLLYHKLKSRHFEYSVIRFILLWVGIEYLRSIGIFGFPWNLLGYTTLAWLPIAQTASEIGVFGLSLFVVSVALMPVLLFELPDRTRQIVNVAIVIILIGAFSLNTARNMREPDTLTETTIRIVQPNIPQSVKMSAGWEQEAMRTMQSMEQGTPVDFTIWPESAYPIPVRGNRITQLMPKSGTLLTGAVRVEGSRGNDLRIYNSILAIDPTGLLLMSYDKHQLVPFGEFVPLRSVLPLEKITPGDLDFSRGSGAQTILLRDQPAFSPLVCYEVIFPWMAVDPMRRPEWIVNLTNDGWYGDTAGPYQHLAAAQMRAIEQGLPVVRAANTGVSAIIDPHGRILEKLPYNSRGVINTKLPKALPATLYAKWHEWPLALLILLSWGFTVRPQGIKKNK